MSKSPDLSLLLDIRIAFVRSRLGVNRLPSFGGFSIFQIECALLGAIQPEPLVPSLFNDESALRDAYSCGEQLIKTLLEKLAAEANNGCGLVYEIFIERFSAAVDGVASYLHPETARILIGLARSIGDYQTKTETEKMRANATEEGLCVHYLDENTCPCGCFEGR